MAPREQLYRRVKQGKSTRYQPVSNGNGVGNGLPLQSDPMYEHFARNMAQQIHNATTLSERSLSTQLGKLLDPRRDYYHELGFPTTEALTAEDYKQLYDREAIASRVVDVMVKECLQEAPIIEENSDLDEQTEFEQAVRSLGKGLRKESWYRSKKYPIVDAYLSRAARLSRIGHFGVILLGLDDGLELSEPVKGVKEEGSLPTAQVGNREITQGPDPFRPVGEDDEPVTRNYLADRHQPGETPTLNGAPPIYSLGRDSERTDNAGLNLIYLRVFDESAVDITRYETNPQSPRYGWPVEYTLTMESDSLGQTSLVSRTVRVHWTRIVHVNGGDLDSSELFHVPSIRPVLNNVLNLNKVYGGDAEGFWRGALTAHSVETHPQLGPDVEIDWDSLKDAYEEFQHSSSRIFGMSGTTLRQHAPSVVDPRSHIDIQLEAIGIKIGIPKRIFMGSERGELSSSEDKGSWNERKMAYCYEVLVPQVYCPFYDRLIFLGVLPEPKYKEAGETDSELGYDVVWPEQELMNPSEQAEVAVKRMDALSKYVQGGVEAIMLPMDMLVRELGYPPEDAEAILEAVMEAEPAEPEDDDERGPPANANQLSQGGQTHNHGDHDQSKHGKGGGGNEFGFSSDEISTNAIDETKYFKEDPVDLDDLADMPPEVEIAIGELDFDESKADAAVLRWKGKTYITDGHHTAVAASLVNGGFAIADIPRRGTQNHGDHDQKSHGRKGGKFKSTAKDPDFRQVDGVINQPEVLGELNIPPKMYHITSVDNVEKIKKEGLKKSKSQSEGGENLGVYMAEDTEMAGIMMDSTIPRGKMVTIEIDTAKIDGDLFLDPEFYTFGSPTNTADAKKYVEGANNREEEYAMYSRRPIPPSAIKVLN